MGILGWLSRAGSKAISWAAFNWKRLLIANLIGFTVQGILIALLLILGMSGLLAIILAKAASWVLFLATMSGGR